MVEHEARMLAKDDVMDLRPVPPAVLPLALSPTPTSTTCPHSPHFSSAILSTYQAKKLSYVRERWNEH